MMSAAAGCEDVQKKDTGVGKLLLVPMNSNSYETLSCGGELQGTLLPVDL